MNEHPLVDDTVEIPVTDLQIIRATLNSAFHHSTVIDLVEQYQKLAQAPKASNLTKALQQALTLIEAYLEMNKEVTPDAE